MTINLIQPGKAELINLRADPLLVEQELDVRPDVAAALEKAAGAKAAFTGARSTNIYTRLSLATWAKGALPRPRCTASGTATSRDLPSTR